MEQRKDGFDPHIVIVESQPKATESLRLSLDLKNQKIVYVSGAQSVLDRVEREQVDLVLIDATNFEDSMNLLRAIRSKTSEEEYLPMAFVNNTKDHTFKQEGFREGVDEIFDQNTSSEEIFIRIQKLLKARTLNKALLRQNQFLRQLERNKEEMIGMIMHDLNNPLTAIKTNLVYLLGQLQNYQEQDVVDALTDADSQTYHLQRMISNLLDITRYETGRLVLDKTSVVVRDLFEGIDRRYRSQASMKSVDLSFLVDRDLVGSFDEGLMRRVIENLLVNAFRYTPKNGKLLIEAKSDNDQLVFAVRNSGPKLSLEIQNQLFQKFDPAQEELHRHKARPGIGLYFCKIALDAHEGSIEYEQSDEWPTSFVCRVSLNTGKA